LWFGLDEVIKGWEIGIATMARGETARLRCAASYAYGESGSQPEVPPNAILVFDVEMIDFKGEFCIVYYILFSFDVASSFTAFCPVCASGFMFI